MEPMRKGKVKIFFSYTKEIDSAYDMIRSALDAKNQGIDVVVGCLEHGESGKEAEYLKEIEQIPYFFGREFHLDAALERRPELIIIEHLAHTNGKHCRHKKRYQDVKELLNAGINVYTTVNVSNIESLHDTVAEILGVGTEDRIPDSVFDNADQVEILDIEPELLITRFGESKGTDTAVRFKQLTALREIALRRCADRLKYVAEKQESGKSYHTGEHVLACLSSAPSNGKIIRTAARMAHAFHSRFTALFVETPAFKEETPENKARLQEHRQLAEQLGAHIEIVYGEDVPFQISEFARLSGITKIVLGQSSLTRKTLLGKPTLTEQLIANSPEIDIHIIPDKNSDKIYRPKKVHPTISMTTMKNVVKTVVMLGAATSLSLLFYELGFTHANIIMVYILGVLLTSIATSHLAYSLIASIASVFIFNYLFTTPRFSLAAYETGYPVTFVVMFLTAFITGTFAIRYKEQAGLSAKSAYRTKILFDTNQLISKAQGKEEILNAVAGQIVKLLGRNIILFDHEEEKLGNPRFFTADQGDRLHWNMERELETAEWVLRNNHSAGATTDTFSDAKYLYYALRVNDRVYGVIGIEADEWPLDASEYSILLSILGECSLALENEKNAREKEEAAIRAKDEQLRANLLRTISHDLRTPLTSISGHASNLLNNETSFDWDTRHEIYRDIYDDSMWLINLVENLLAATRLEEGRMMMRTSTELLSDIIEEAVHYMERKNRYHVLLTEQTEEMILVRADAKLIVQVLVNLIDNAMKYTPAQSFIKITAEKEKNAAVVTVADNGNGISDEEKERIFDKFYCGENKIGDSRRSLGLGLFLCKAIVEAHGGVITVKDNEPKGTIFQFRIPMEGVKTHEQI